MKIGKYHLDALDKFSYVVYKKKVLGNDGCLRAVDPSYFSRPNITLALKHIRNSMIDEKVAENEVKNLDDFLRVIKSEEKKFREYTKNIAQ